MATGTFADILFGEAIQYDTPIYGVRKKLPNFLLWFIRQCLPIAVKIPKLKGYANWFRRGDVSSMKQYLLLNERVNSDFRGLLPECDMNRCAPRMDEVEKEMCRVSLAAEDEYTLVDTLLYAHCWNELFERIGSHYGVDVIHPFQTQELYRLSLCMPYKGKIARKFTKPYLRALAASLFSPELAYSQKQIFSSPGRQWLMESSALQKFVNQLASPQAKIGMYVNREALLQQLKEFNEKVKSCSLDQYTAQFIYTLIGFEIWLQKYFD
jgi:asparagine synthetase B (glutamine-hydrolysing)